MAPPLQSGQIRYSNKLISFCQSAIIDKVMTRKTRTILFIILFFLFILLAPAAVLYSQGYRFDFGEKKFSQTGGLFLKILPRQAEIYLDGKLKKKTDFFFGSALIENLLPGKYEIKVKKQGFHSWTKTLELKEKQVTDAKNIVLFPENPEFEILSSNVINFWFSPDQKKIILQEREQQGWSLKLYEIENKVKSRLVDERSISINPVDLLSLSFTKDPNEITLTAGLGEEVRYFSLKLNRTPFILIETAPPSFPSKNIVVLKEIGADIFYFTNSGHLFKNDEKLTQTPLTFLAETKYELEVFQDNIFLLEGKNLYQFEAETQSLEKIFDNTQNIKIAPDNKKLVYFSEREIWILFLKETNGSQQKQPGDKVLLLRLSEEIDDVFWLSSHYLVFNTGNFIKITETDERDGMNIVDLKPPTTTNGGGLEIFWNSFDKKLYILSKGNLYFSTSLLP